MPRHFKEARLSVEIPVIIALLLCYVYQTKWTVAIKWTTMDCCNVLDMQQQYWLQYSLPFISCITALFQTKSYTYT